MYLNIKLVINKWNIVVDFFIFLGFNWFIYEILMCIVVKLIWI